MRAVGPVVRELELRGWEVGVATSSAAEVVARRLQLKPGQLTPIDAASGAGDAVRGRRWRLLVIGIGEGSSPERALMTAARAAGTPILGLLDTWGDYERRVVEPATAGAWPDVLAVMTENVRDEIVRYADFPGRVAAVGQPGLEEFLRVGPSQSAAREALGLEPAAEVVAFFSQPIAQRFGRSLGYTQYDAIRCLSERLPADVQLVIASHPRDHGPALDDAAAGRATILDDYDPGDVYAAATVVASCFSACLIEATLALRPTLSVQPGLIGADRCWTSSRGISETVRDGADFDAAFARTRGVAVADLERRRDSIGIVPGAAGRVAALAEELVS